SSPGDLAPVFDAMLEKATRLCKATYGGLHTYDGKRFHLAAIRGDRHYVEWARQGGTLQPTTTDVPLGRIIRGERMVQIADVREENAYRTAPKFREHVELGGIRSYLTVALRKDDILLGAIIVYRQEVRPFSEKEITLLENFAAQAVIAMENARLLGELRERTEE